MNRPLHTLDRSYAGLRRGLVAALVVGYAVILAACGGSGSKSDTTDPTAPTITTQPQNQTVTVGATAMFTVAATGTAPLSYQWSKNGTAISGATSSSYTTPATVSGDNGASFTVTVSN
ncbi:MAG TPA: immunoglobulin domain-containing protein, partial [Steroidobacteraceae bacterium]|nr:immunoglobulin domain-containing protein [Steroidobacteraceae bacterium]